MELLINVINIVTFSSYFIVAERDQAMAEKIVLISQTIYFSHVYCYHHMPHYRSQIERVEHVFTKFHKRGK